MIFVSCLIATRSIDEPLLKLNKYALTKQPIPRKSGIIVKTILILAGIFLFSQNKMYKLKPHKIMHPPVIRMALQVYNYSQLPVTFDFTTSQRYDFAIYDSMGREVWRWSDDKGFLQVIGQLILQPGESVVYTAEHVFTDKNGEPMPTDLYTLKGELTATGRDFWAPRIMEGKVSFWHRNAQ